MGGSGLECGERGCPGEVGGSGFECGDRECPGEMGGSGLKCGEVRESGLECPGEVGGSTLRCREEEEGVGSVELWPVYKGVLCMIREYLYS